MGYHWSITANVPSARLDHCPDPGPHVDRDDRLVI